MKNKLTLGLFIATVLAACGDKTYTVDEFVKDPAVRDQFLTKCHNGELHPDNINCINAKKSKLYEPLH